MDQPKYLEQKLEQYMITGGAATPLDQNFAELLENATDETIPDFPYRSSVGSLMYAMRPDVASAVSRYLEKPKKVHCEMVMRIWRYRKSNAQLVLVYKPSGNTKLKGYVDASYEESRS
jgi:hypothetical protein